VLTFLATMATMANFHATIGLFENPSYFSWIASSVAFRAIKNTSLLRLRQRRADFAMTN
jgi:hypothetical protein